MKQILNKKALKRIGFTILIILISILIYFTTFFELLPLGETLLAEFLNTKSGERFFIYHYSSDATIEESIQVKLLEGDHHKTIKIFNNYNYLVGLTFISDDTLRIIIDNTRFLNNTPDTMYIDLNKYKE